MHQHKGVLIASAKGDFVASIPLSLKLEPKTLERWKKKFPPEPYEAGSVLFYRGHNPYGVYLVFSGKVELKLSEVSDHTVLQVPAGSVIGLSSAIVDHPYPVTALVQTNVQASFVPKQVLREWIRKKETLFPKELRLILKRST